MAPCWILFCQNKLFHSYLPLFTEVPRETVRKGSEEPAV
jgi:hypothetical protein